MKLALLTAVHRQVKGVITLTWATPRSSDPTDRRGGSRRVRTPTRLVTVTRSLPMIAPGVPAVTVAMLVRVSRLVVAQEDVAEIVTVAALLAGKEANVTTRLLPPPPQTPPPVAMHSVKVSVDARLLVIVTFSTVVARLFSSVIV